MFVALSQNSVCSYASGSLGGQCVLSVGNRLRYYAAAVTNYFQISEHAVRLLLHKQPESLFSKQNGTYSVHTCTQHVAVGYLAVQFPAAVSAVWSQSCTGRLHNVSFLQDASLSKKWTTIGFSHVKRL
ncbi:unnamed protein product, partial [Ectocarpus sp. 4 AP-2014]